MERRYFEHFGRTSKSARYAGWLYFRARNVIAHILKWMRNLTGSQYNRFRIGTERLNRGALVTTFGKQFWTHCNLAISFSGILWKTRYSKNSVLVSIEMLIMSVTGVINMSRQCFNTLLGMGSRLHDFDDELNKISFLISFSDARSKTFILDLISVFLYLWNILYFI